MRIVTRPEEAGRLEELLREVRAADFFAFDFQLSARMQRDPLHVPMPVANGGTRPSRFIHSLAIATAAGIWRVQIRAELMLHIASLFELPILKARLQHLIYLAREDFVDASLSRSI